MALYLVVKAGPTQGESFTVSEGITLGRKGTTIRLNDSKVSSKHAEIQKNSEGYFELVDLGSKNGLLVKGQRVDAVVLTPGAEFEVGNSTFMVLETSEPAQKEERPAKKKKSRKRWNEVLSQFLRKSLFEVENSTVALEPMRPALVLDFLRGPQADTRWILGYGPRRVGRLSVDLPVFEAKASEVCFEVAPSPNGISFTAVGKEVRLNGKSVSSEILKVGDRIQIFGTEIEVDFIE